MTRSDETFRSQVSSTAGKVSGNYSDWFNVKNLDDDKVQSIDWKTINKSKPLAQDEFLLTSHDEFTKWDILIAKLEELEKMERSHLIKYTW